MFAARKRPESGRNSLMSGRAGGMPCDGRSAFPRVFAQWLERSGRPIKIVAAEIGVAASTVCQWRDGKRVPDLENLKIICLYTGIPLCRLICDKPDCVLRNARATSMPP